MLRAFGIANVLRGDRRQSDPVLQALDASIVLPDDLGFDVGEIRRDVGDIRRGAQGNGRSGEQCRSQRDWDKNGETLHGVFLLLFGERWAPGRGRQISPIRLHGKTSAPIYKESTRIDD